jgi:hypothetical protein
MFARILMTAIWSCLLLFPALHASDGPRAGPNSEGREARLNEPNPPQVPQRAAQAVTWPSLAEGPARRGAGALQHPRVVIDTSENCQRRPHARCRGPAAANAVRTHEATGSATPPGFPTNTAV